MNSDELASSQPQTSWIDRLSQAFLGEPKDKEQLLGLLKNAKDRALMDTEALTMIEGVLQVSELRVRDIMIPRAQMVMVGRDESLDRILPVIIDSAHSRFPVIGDDRSEVVGVLLAKDLLAYLTPERSSRFSMRDVLRLAVFVPESKRLNVLLKEFRSSRNHMAIVVDEYGAAAGLVTIEDVLEQIVGDIEDEHDFDEGATIHKRSRTEYMVKAHTPIEDFNAYFSSSLEDKSYDTIAGLVTHALGHLPKRGESVRIDPFTFKVLRADSRRLRLLSVHLPESDSNTALDADGG